MTFNRLFVSIFFLSLFAFCGVAAAADFSLVSKTASATDATIKIKASASVQIDAANLTLYQYPITLSSPSVEGEYRTGDGRALATDRTFQEKFTGLRSGEKYLIRVIYKKTGDSSLFTQDLGDITAKDVVTAQGIELPVEFVKSDTSISGITVKLRLSNTSTKKFNVTVVAKLDGAIVETRPTSVAPNSTAIVSFYSGMTPGKTYDFVMTGTQDGAPSIKYKPVTYEGVKVEGITGGAIGIITPPTKTSDLAIGAQSAKGSNVDKTTSPTMTTCTDGIDNDGDGRIDWTGGKIGGTPVGPDPSCISALSKEVPDDVVSNIIPCTNKCDLGSVFELINKLITFLITFLVLPVTIILFMYAGFKYITAQGNPSKIANVRKMVQHLVGGLLLVLCAWIIVKTLLLTLGYTDQLYFFE